MLRPDIATGTLVDPITFHWTAASRVGEAALQSRLHERFPSMIDRCFVLFGRGKISGLTDEVAQDIKSFTKDEPVEELSPKTGAATENLTVR